MNWLIHRLHKPGTSGQKGSLECDIQKSITRMDALVKWGRKIKGGDGAFQDFFVSRREFREGDLGVFEK